LVDSVVSDKRRWFVAPIRRTS